MDYDKTKEIEFVDIDMTEKELEACLKEAEYQDQQGKIEWKSYTDPIGMQCCGKSKSIRVGTLLVIWEDEEWKEYPPKYRYWWAERTGCDEYIEFVICEQCRTLTIARDC